MYVIDIRSLCLNPVDYRVIHDDFFVWSIVIVRVHLVSSLMPIVAVVWNSCRYLACNQPASEYISIAGIIRTLL